jgi:hypothetical protein
VEGIYAHPKQRYPYITIVVDVAMVHVRSSTNLETSLENDTVLMNAGGRVKRVGLERLNLGGRTGSLGLDKWQMADQLTEDDLFTFGPRANQRKSRTSSALAPFSNIPYKPKEDGRRTCVMS